MAFAIGVAASRVYVGHHYPSDVLLGAILGAATGAVGYGLAFAGADRRPRWAWWLWAQLAVVLFAGIGAYLGLTRFEFLRWPYMDKVMHFGLYGALAFFLVAWFAERPPVRVVAGLLTIAILDEVVQGLSPARSFDVVDLACTVAGIVVCASLGARAVGLDRRAVVQMTSA
jgi:VanZ family protein